MVEEIGSGEGGILGLIEVGCGIVVGLKGGGGIDGWIEGRIEVG